MIPFHSLPVGCVCNFLEYKSCIIHVYQRATSINYVSLLGACIFTTSSLSFILRLLSGAPHHSGAPGRECFLCFHLAPRVLVWFTRVKGTVSNSHREKKMKGIDGEKEKVCSGAVM